MLNSKKQHLEHLKLKISGENAIVAVVSQQDFIDVLNKITQNHQEKIISLMKEIPGFQFMSKSGFRKLLTNFTCEKVSPGWHHERKLERLYLIIDG